jgi:hypothetical protein
MDYFIICYWLLTIFENNYRIVITVITIIYRVTGESGMGKTYEVVTEIFNRCSGNQMRDVFFEEAEIDDPDAYVRERFKNCAITLEDAGAPGKARIYEIEECGLRRRISFTEI